EALQLHDLAVIDEEVNFGAVVLDVPGEHLGIGGLEHQPFQPSSSANCATTSVRQVVTFSVIPSDSTIIMKAPASRKRRAWPMAQLGSRVPSASNSAAAVAPPAPN